MRVATVLCLAAVTALAEDGRDEPAPAARAFPMRSQTVKSTRLRQEPHWPLVQFELGLIVYGRQNVFFGADLVAGVPLGAPVKQGLRSKVASGWTVMPLVEASYGSLSGPLCGGARMCGQRYLVGPGLKLGHGVGVMADEGVVRPVRMLYVQASAVGGVVDVPTGPLSPGEAWFEGAVRARLGGHLGSLDLTGESGFLSTFSLNLAVVAEWVVLSLQGTRGLSVGGVVGLAF